MKPKLVQGSRDFGPLQLRQRKYIFNTLCDIFSRFGFQEIETPALEMLSTLQGKYGDEGDQLLFKILNNGDYLNGKEVRKQSSPEELEKILAEKDSAALSPLIASRGLRYDLTVPFARFVVLNRNDIAFPFKRYQIQPVWRGDRPQKGRYREFYQCDVDVIGSDSLLYEAELLQVYDQAFTEFDVKVDIRLNNRKLLEALAQMIGQPELFMPITVAIDKLDKIEWKGVAQELEKLGLDEQQQQQIQAAIQAKSLEELAELFGPTNEVGQKGIAELQEVLAFLEGYSFSNNLVLDFSLARGLSYYTGCIFEVVVDTTAPGQEKVKMGSIGGGGRYDNLTAVFGWEGNSGVGCSFGAARIFDVMEELGRFDQIPQDEVELFFLCMDNDSLKYGFNCLQACRAAGIKADIYPEAAKFKKQMKYADKRGLQKVVIIGESERTSGQLQLKNMKTGEQSSLSLEELIAQLKA